jgi:hypothetical protein
VLPERRKIPADAKLHQKIVLPKFRARGAQTMQARPGRDSSGLIEGLLDNFWPAGHRKVHAEERMEAPTSSDLRQVNLSTQGGSVSASKGG